MNFLRKLIKGIGAILVVIGTFILTICGIIWFGAIAYDIYNSGGVNALHYTFIWVQTILSGALMILSGLFLNKM